MMRKTSEFFRKLSLRAEKNWHQNNGAKRREVIRDMAAKFRLFVNAYTPVSIQMRTLERTAPLRLAALRHLIEIDGEDEEIATGDSLPRPPRGGIHTENLLSMAFSTNMNVVHVHKVCYL